MLARRAAGCRVRRPTITLVTHDSFAVSKSVLAAFTKQTGHQGEGPAVRRRRRRAQPGDPHQVNPIGDVFFGVDNTFLSRGARRRRVRAVRARGARRPCPTSTSSTPHTASRPIDHGDVCINYDKQWFAEQEARGADDARRPHQARVQGPAGRREPGDVVARASRSCSPRSPRYGDDGWRDYWTQAAGQRREGRRRLGERVRRRLHPGRPTRARTRSWCRTRRARRPRCTSRSRSRRRRPSAPCSTRASARWSSPACSRAPSTRPRRASSSTSCCREQFQADVPLQMFVFPVRDGTPLPAVFTKFAEVAAEPVVAPARRDQRAP